MKGDFISNLGRIYGVYTGGFLGFVILLAILEQLGVPNKIIGYLFVFFTIAVYAGIGILSRTMQVSEYYVAGRRVPPLYNGMATAADWMSAASFIAMAGGLYARGYDGLAFVLGWTGGYVLVAVLIAPYLRKFGAYTVPDFLGARFGGNFARSIGILVLFACSFTYIVGQVVGVGTIASRFLGISFEIAVFVGLIGILVCSMMGGMRAVTWTQVAQYIVLIIAYLVPVVILSAQTTGIPIPQLMYGEILQRITELEQTKPALAGAQAHVMPFTTFDPLNFFALILCLMVGTASLPHVLMRFFTTPSVRDARKSVGWSLLFIFLLYFTAPAYAAFAKYEIFTNVIGATIAELPNWVKIYSDIGLVTIADANKDGILQFAELKINPDVIVIATPEIAGLPYVIAGLVAAGGLAAALSTADGLLLAIANALSHDIYYRMIDPQASTAKRLVVARILLVVVAILAAAVASTRPGGILALVAWAFSLAAAGLFPVLVLGVWWKRCTKEGAIAGMLVGFGFTLFYLVGTKYFGMPLWFGVSNISAGLFGIPTGFLATIIVSMMTPPPSREMQDFIDSIRIPRGQTLMEEKA
ncbi:sodium:solute symporter family protein [Oceanibaculum indicum]|uniref:Na+/solute symporter (Ssf family) protein n=2 Tax=Oceanibaculum indicum TaxID=526216 RepID=K2J2V0_9PROT|nr:sodium:solute symporter family protein [Oceanibaculum indicum]EKE77321.1 Na+/solute symporter (Ssf family) protein [Oceanibaculum indicum P24]RKQ68089.1 cation/acetate symporter [Oceanibaculum indicum]